MISRLSRARKHYLCDCCGQLIVPGEVYRYQCWSPWEMEDAEGYYSAPACRWCAERAWAYIEKLDPDFDERTWTDDNLFSWLEHELGGTHDPLDRASWLAAREVLQQAQREASAFMAFLRRFAKGAKPAAIRRVGPALLAVGFGRPPEGGLDHMLSTSGFPGQEWWRCQGCNQHHCDCTCPHYNTPGTECCGLFPCDCECEV